MMNENKEKVEQPEIEESVAEAGNSVAEAEVGKTSSPDTVESSETEKLRQQLEEQKNDYLRLAAEFDNFRKRSRRDLSEIIKTANESLVGELLDVLDNFERAIKSREENADGESFAKGIALVYDKLLQILMKTGLSRFESVGQPFDPRLHEAIMQVEDDAKDPDTVAGEFLAGYTLNDKVIRHAKVSVVQPKLESK